MLMPRCISIKERQLERRSLDELARISSFAKRFINGRGGYDMSCHLYLNSWADDDNTMMT